MGSFEFFLAILVLFKCGWGTNSENMKYSGPDCSFLSEDLCGYKNVFRDEIDPQWIRQKAPAEENRYTYHHNPVRMTVYGNHPMEWPPHGNYYLYTGPTKAGVFAEMFAEIKSPYIHVNDTKKCLHFTYHNQVPIHLVPTLIVRMQNENTTENDNDDDSILAEFHSTQSSKWFEARVPLPVGEYSLVFAGRNYNNDITPGGQLAITNIAILEGHCTSSVAEWLQVPGDCGFEMGQDLCGYRYANDSTVKLLGFVAENLPLAEQQQRSQRKPPDDRFLLINQKFYQIANQGSKARLQSPMITTEREGCIYMSYYNSIQPKVDENNVLNILQLQNFNEKLLFRLPIPKSNRDKWYQLNGALPKGTYRLIVETIYTNDYTENDYVGFDNIEIFNKSCLDMKQVPDVCNAQIPDGHILCKNQGSCISFGKKSFRCSCKDGYHGNRCEHKYPCHGTPNPCKNGGTCKDDGLVDIFCQCQTGFEGKLCEKIKTCGSAEGVVKHARLLWFLNDTYLSQARFQCNDGRLAEGELTATCTANGIWVTQGKCLVVNCGEPPNLSQLTLVNVSNTTLNGQAKYKCFDGYIIFENQDVLTCRSVGGYQRGSQDIVTGNWIRYDGNLGVYGLACHQIPRCGNPPTLLNAEVTVTSELMHGVASYECRIGFAMNTDLPVAERVCSQDSRWRSKSGKEFECWALPECGSPPEVQFSTVNYTNTTINSTAFYSCKHGYHLVGEQTAVCWKTSDNQRQKWVDWIFVPTCEYNCPAKVGRRGNVSTAVLKVSTCSLSGYRTFSANMDCGKPISYIVRRHRGLKPENRNGDRIVFYGSELCIAERTTKIKRYGNSVVFNATKCKSFCLQKENDIYDIVIYDDITFLNPQVNLGAEQFVKQNLPFSNQLVSTENIPGFSSGSLHGISRRQTILRYETKANSA